MARSDGRNEPADALHLRIGDLARLHLGDARLGEALREYLQILDDEGANDMNHLEVRALTKFLEGLFIAVNKGLVAKRLTGRLTVEPSTTSMILIGVFEAMQLSPEDALDELETIYTFVRDHFQQTQPGRFTYVEPHSDE